MNIFKSPLKAASALLLLAVTFPAQAEVDPSFHLYLLIGQSNMAGRGLVDAESAQTHPQVLMLTKALEWKPATDPLHFDKPVAGVGPGFTFGKVMAEQNPKVRIGLVPCAVGGTSIKVWLPGAEDPATKTHPYDDMLVRITEAQKSGVLKGIIWNQGESDRNALAVYGQQLTELISRIRNELHTDVGFVGNELPVFAEKDAASAAAFNDTVRKLEGAVPKFVCVSAEGLTDKGDKVHYDTPSARILGKRYAEKMTQLQK